MKILYYSPHPQLSMYAPTGYGTHIREMIAAWRRMDIEVRTFIAGDLDQGEYQSAENTGKGKFGTAKKLIPGFVWQSLRDFSLMRFDREQQKILESQIEIFKPDIIYERVAYLQNSGIRTAQRYGIKHIAEINAPYPEERISFSGDSFFLAKARKMEREILIHSNGISVVSSALKKYLSKILPEAESKILVVPNSVNPASAELSLEKNEKLRVDYNIDNEIVVGFVGSMFPYHGVDVLIKAFAKIPEEKNVRLLIVGDGAILPDLKALAKSLNVFQKVIFTGSLPHREVYANIELMDICCMPKSNWYGSPVKIFEYGLLQKPVIAPNEVPMHDVMGADDGELVEPNVNDFYAAMMKLISDETRRKLIAANWHQKVMQNYTWDAAAKKTLTLCI
ncbi:glycosyltransferase family 4 protein [Cryomorpha ignava]|uniref:Glycosyltransferase family 4 protein n=1 Tax=Cryomorpha ignava TaxID=101383 RepID=A0A7K3WQU4_9FLAO|nr:glycosyltransferase family 4 protein [Cryomorpha ignava]NEN24050.1 glycosyltransferase family 4 protein [Cryomorpha ignava]